MTWIEILDRAIGEGGFTLEDRIRKNDWRTCAVGEALHLQPNEQIETIYIVKDLILHSVDPLYVLGMGFHNAIDCNDPEIALKKYLKINEYVQRRKL